MYKYYFKILLFIVLVFGIIIFAWQKKKEVLLPQGPQVNNEMRSGSFNAPADQQSSSQSSEDQKTNSDFQPPLDKPQERVTKKYFGLFVSPGNSPVRPERFTGFHTGADFETFPAEQNEPVAVRAACSGKLLMKRYASGYGGVAAQACTLNGNPITVVYGHLKLTSIASKVGSQLKVGDQVGLLGQGYSLETDGERKHLHLGFHKGSVINILGYVSSRSALSEWIDPCQYVCGK